MTQNAIHARDGSHFPTQPPGIAFFSQTAFGRRVGGERDVKTPTANRTAATQKEGPISVCFESHSQLLLKTRSRLDRMEQKAQLRSETTQYIYHHKFAADM